MPVQSSTTEELTAYLDGELDPGEHARVEKRLTTDPEYLSEMQALQKTWDLIGSLSGDRARASFTQSTMEFVVGDAIKQVRKKSTTWWLWPLRLGLIMALPAILFAASFQLTRSVQLHPNRQLVSNLPLIENFDPYSKVDRDMNFLTQLDQLNLFLEDDELYSHDSQGTGELPADLFSDAQPGKPPSRETIEERQQRLASLSIDEKNTLRRKMSLYLNLSSQQQDQLQKFHSELAEHPDRNRLTQVMKDYYKWLKTLGLSQQAELLDLPYQERLKEIAEIKSGQAREAFGRSGATRLPTERDAEFLFDWYEVTLATNEKRIRERFSKVLTDYLRQKNRSVSPVVLERFAQRQPLDKLVVILVQVDREGTENLLMQYIDLLRSGLSFEAQAIFDEQSAAEQKELLMNWIASAYLAKSTISPEKLQLFYEQLPTQERDQLDKMAPENWVPALTEKYRNRYSSESRPISEDEFWESLF